MMGGPTSAPTPQATSHDRRFSDRWAVALWIIAAIIVGAILGALYPDAYHQDGGTHFLYARDAFREHWRLVDVWGRPLFTSVYAVPALLGYRVAKFATVLICAAVGYHTWQLAREMGFARAPLVVPFLFLEPSLLMLSSETMTEPLFALVFVIALRLRQARHESLAAGIASLLPLARPEGFFIVALWGIWTLFAPRGDRSIQNRIRATLSLAAGIIAWTVAAWAIVGDPLWIIHNWPQNWPATTVMYGHGTLYAFVQKRDEILNAWLVAPFVLGLVILLRRRQAPDLTSSTLMLFVVHTLLWRFGLFGSAGFARYFVCVAPALAIITLSGWNAIANIISVRSRAAYLVAAVVVLLAGFASALRYVDDMQPSRDARAIDEMSASLADVPRDHLIASQAYMCIQLHCTGDGWFQLTSDSALNMERLRATPPGTIVYWDDDIGPSWYHLRPADIESAGFHVIRARSYKIPGVIPRLPWQAQAPMRLQTLTVLAR